jgi:hypothetical protein
LGGHVTKTGRSAIEEEEEEEEEEETEEEMSPVELLFSIRLNNFDPLPPSVHLKAIAILPFTVLRNPSSAMNEICR